jgi:glycogen synthase
MRDGQPCFVHRICGLRAAEPEKWQTLRKAAAEARFRWSDSAKQYVEKLYRK